MRRMVPSSATSSSHSEGEKSSLAKKADHGEERKPNPAFAPPKSAPAVMRSTLNSLPVNTVFSDVRMSAPRALESTRALAYEEEDSGLSRFNRKRPLSRTMEQSSDLSRKYQQSDFHFRASAFSTSAKQGGMRWSSPLSKRAEEILEDTALNVSPDELVPRAAHPASAKEPHPSTPLSRIPIKRLDWENASSWSSSSVANNITSQESISSSTQEDHFASASAFSGSIVKEDAGSTSVSNTSSDELMQALDRLESATKMMSTSGGTEQLNLSHVSADIIATTSTTTSSVPAASASSVASNRRQTSPLPDSSATASSGVCEMDLDKIEAEWLQRKSLSIQTGAAHAAVSSISVTVPSTSATSSGGSDAKAYFAGASQSVNENLGLVASQSASSTSCGVFFARYIVDSVSATPMVKILNAYLKTSEATSTIPVKIHLADDWKDTLVQANQTVHVVWDKPANNSIEGSNRATAPVILVSDTCNFLIVLPDLVCSATTIADSLSCVRSSILRERMIESTSSIETVLGTLKHQTFQHGLAHHDMSQLDRAAIQEISSGESRSEAFAVGLKLQDARNALIQALPFMASWGVAALASGIPLMFGTTSISQIIRIVKTIGIEETIVSRMWGLTGKLDATVLLSINDGAQYLVAPLELKTSKAPSGEHFAQVQLYSLLIEDRYYGMNPSDSNIAGILTLVNAKGHTTLGISKKRRETKVLIMARNRFVSMNSPASPLLPPVLGRASTCGRCFQRDTCTIVHVAQERGDLESMGLPQDDFNKITSHLSHTDLTYLNHWMKLLELEEKREFSARKPRESQVERNFIDGLTLLSTSCGSSHVVGEPVEWIFAAQSPVHNLTLKVGDRVSIGIDGAHERLGLGKLLEIGDMRIRVRSTMSVSNCVPTFLNSSKWRVENASFTFSASIIKKVRASLLATFMPLRLMPPPTPSPPDSLLASGTLSSNQVYLSGAALREQQRSSHLIKQGTTGHHSRPVTPNEFADVLLRSNSNRDTFLRENFRANARVRSWVVGGDSVGGLKRPKFVDDDDGSDTYPIGFLRNASAGAANAALERSRTLQEFRQLLKVSGDSPCEGFFSHLTPDQFGACLSVLAARDYVCISGVPGAGKSTVMACIAAVLHRLGKSVLITSYTHTAVDNLLSKIRDSHGLPVVRLLGKDGLPSSDDLRSDSDDEDSEHLFAKNIIVGMTCLGTCNNGLLRRRRFDYVIVDEAGQLLEPLAMSVMRFADVSVLVGDHRQLPPLVQSEEAKEQGMDISLFRRLIEHHQRAQTVSVVETLTTQFRMNADICSLANELMYDGIATCASEELRARKIVLSEKIEHPFTSKWMEASLDPARSVVFIDTSDLGDGAYETNTEDKEGQENAAEVSIVCSIVEGLVSRGLSEAEKNIGIITPFRSQLRLFQEKLGDSVEASTVDSYQGRDKEIILVSFVRANPFGNVGKLLLDDRRLNVALTRARSKLIIVGHAQTIGQGSPICKSLLDIVRKHEWYVNAAE